MFVFKPNDSEELSDMKIAGDKSTLLGWVISNYPAGTDHYDCGKVTYVRLNQEEIGVIAKVEFIN